MACHNRPQTLESLKRDHISFEIYVPQYLFAYIEAYVCTHLVFFWATNVGFHSIKLSQSFLIFCDTNHICMHIVYWPLIRYIVHHWGTTHQQLILWATRSPVRKKALKKKMSVKSFDECKPWGIKHISILLKSTVLKSWIDYCATFLQPVAYKQSDFETSSLPIRYNPTIKTI